MAAPRLILPGALLALAALGASGCATAPPSSRSIGTLMAEASEAGLQGSARLIEQTLKEMETFGYAQPFAPVVLPPDIRRVWVLTHVSPDGELVSGHWVYLRLTDWRWFIETEPKPLELGAVPGAPQVGSPEPPLPPVPRAPAPRTGGGLPWSPAPPAEAAGPEAGATPAAAAQPGAVPPPRGGAPTGVPR